MNHGLAKAAFGALACGGLLAGCATTVETSNPFWSYRYHYDSRVESPAPAVVYRAPAVTYTEPTVTYTEPAVTYPYTRPAPAITYHEPVVVYRHGVRVDDGD